MKTNIKQLLGMIFGKSLYFGLRKKYSLQIAVVVLFVAVSITLFAGFQFHMGMESVARQVKETTGDALHRQMRDKAEVVMDTLSRNLLNPFYYMDVVAIDDLFRSVRRQKDVRYVYLYDPAGKIITDGTGRNELVGKMMTDSVTNKILASNGLVFQENDGMLDVSLPIVFGDKELGKVRVGFSLRQIDEDIEKEAQIIADIKRVSAFNTLLVSLIVSLLLVICGILFAFRIAHGIASPIIDLMEASRNIGAGDLSTRVYINTNDELEELAESFNQMVTDLDSRRKELTTLPESTKFLTGDLEKEPLLKNALRVLKDMLKVTKCSVMFLDGCYLVTAAVLGWKPGEVPRSKHFSIGEGIAGQVVQKSASIVANDVNVNTVFEREDHKVWRGCKNLLCVPILHEGKAKGVLNIQDRIDGKPFTKIDLEYAEIIASSVAMSLANIGLVEDKVTKTRMEAELKTAETVQRTLIPAKPPAISGVDLADYFQPATETGGDWFGYIEDADTKRLAILIGDVSGHGVAAALVTAAVNSFFKTLDIMNAGSRELRGLFEKFKAEKASPTDGTLAQIEARLGDTMQPVTILKLLNKIVIETGGRHLMMSFFVSVLELDSKILSFSNAGHIQPFLYRKDRSGEESASGTRKNFSILKSFGMRLGDEQAVDFKEQKIQLKRGDILFWLTDGVVECKNDQGEEFGEKRLWDIIHTSADLSAQAIKEKIVLRINDFTGKRQRSDDLAFVIAKIG